MYEYKKFLIKILLLVFSILILMFFIGDSIIKNENFKVNSQEIFAVHKWIEKKYQISDSTKTKSPRIIFFGGSNVLFGTNSKMIEEEINMTTINMGLHAGYRDYLYRYIKPQLKKGDILILELEYENYHSYKEELNELSIPYIISYDKDYYKSFDLFSKIKIVSFLYSKKMLNSFFSKKIKEEKITAYSTKNFNDHGDITLNYGTNYEKINKLKFKEANLEFTTDYKNYELYKFIKDCQNKGIKVYSVPCAFYKFKDLDSKKSKLELEKIFKFYEFADVKYLGNPYDTMYKENDMYDTESHLNQQAATKHTKYLINLIKKDIIQENN